MSSCAEPSLIENISRVCSGSHKGLVKGIGDDCCEISKQGSWLISTDTLVDSIHFDRRWHPPALLGRKSVAVNLSDIAAMGGRPYFVLLSLCLPVDLDGEWINQFLDGAHEILQEFDTQLIGGDTVKGKELVITVTVFGQPQQCGSIYRNGASIGDSIWVSGVLGSAGAGLELLAAETKERMLDGMSRYQALINAHLNPLPRIEYGLDLAQSKMVTAMQDISDGLATDLAHICNASRVGASLEKNQIPFHSALPAAAMLLNRSIEDFILRSGEDYELLFTVKKDCEKEFLRFMEEKGRTAHQIGMIRAGEGVFLRTESGEEEISFQGYEH